MLRLLLFLSVLVLQPHAQLAVDLDISSCPVRFYGMTASSKIYTGSTIFSASFCFGGVFSDPSVTQECVVFSLDTTPSDVTPSFTDSADLSASEVAYQAALPTITESLVCEVSFTVDDVTLKFASFTTRTALFVEATTATHVVIVLVNGAQPSTFIVDPTGLAGSPSAYLDISGCRDSTNAHVVPGDDITDKDPSTCEKVICNELSEVEAVQGDGSCDSDGMCTVIGNTIIDFDDNTAMVSDRCKYTLTSSADLTVDATFRERLIRTQSFLDILDITETAAGVPIIIHQDGTIKVGGILQTLTDMPASYGGSTGMLSKDSKGIKYTGFDHRIVFDARSTAITYLGTASPLSGLSGICRDASDLSSNKDTTADTTCTDPQTDPDSDKYELDCDTAPPSRCNLLDEEPFTACHGTVDPAPYKMACLHTLCFYPERDGFGCQFMVNYVNKCKDHGVTLEVNLFSLGCAHHKAFCDGETCLDEEYCGMMSNGRYGCFCRGDLSASHREDGTYGGELECTADSATLTLHGCFLKEHNINPTRTHLNDDSCMGSYDAASKELTLTYSSADTCSAEVEYVTDQITGMEQLKYTNAVRGGDDPLISRTEDFTLSFSCFFDQPKDQMATFFVQLNKINGIIVDGVPYTMSTLVAKDPGFNDLVMDMSSINVDQKVFVKITADTLNSNLMVLVIDRCYAQDYDMTTMAVGSLSYDLITDGCAVDSTVVTTSIGEDTSNSFCFNMFQFTGHTEMKLTCEVRLCAPTSPPGTVSSCVPDCGVSGRRRRSAQMNYINEAPALMSMTWTH